MKHDYPPDLRQARDAELQHAQMLKQSEDPDEQEYGRMLARSGPAEKAMKAYRGAQLRSQGNRGKLTPKERARGTAAMRRYRARSRGLTKARRGPTQRPRATALPVLPAGADTALFGAEGQAGELQKQCCEEYVVLMPCHKLVLQVNVDAPDLERSKCAGRAAAGVFPRLQGLLSARDAHDQMMVDAGGPDSIVQHASGRNPNHSLQSAAARPAASFGAWRGLKVMGVRFEHGQDRTTQSDRYSLPEVDRADGRMLRALCHRAVGHEFTVMSGLPHHAPLLQLIRDSAAALLQRHNRALQATVFYRSVYVFQTLFSELDGGRDSSAVLVGVIAAAVAQIDYRDRMSAMLNLNRQSADEIDTESSIVHGAAARAVVTVRSVLQAMADNGMQPGSEESREVWSALAACPRAFVQQQALCWSRGTFDTAMPPAFQWGESASVDHLPFTGLDPAQLAADARVAQHRMPATYSAVAGAHTAGACQLLRAILHSEQVKVRIVSIMGEVLLENTI